MSASPQRCSHCQANLLPKKKLKQTDNNKTFQESPSLKQSLLESLDHSNRLMQYKQTLYGQQSKFYRMPLNYYHNMKVKRAYA